MAWERNEWTIGRGFGRHRDDQIGFFKPDDRLDLTKICPRGGAGKLSRPVLPDRELTKGGSAITSGCQQRARAMKLRYVAWWRWSRERKPTGFGNGFGRCLASVSMSRQGSE